MPVPVSFEGFPVGEITTEGDVEFLYSERWLAARGVFPISVTMPLADTPYPASTILPWLANLLPEGQALLAMGRSVGASPDDIVELLSHSGRDTAGALSIGPTLATASPPRYMPVGSDEDLQRIIAELPAKPFLVGEEGVSMSLAGVQDKLTVAIADGKVAIPVNGAPSTHILKPDSDRLPGSVFNEAFCLTLARLCRLNTAAVTTRRAGDSACLLVERYDRRPDESRPTGWIRIHQEDFCQALGLPPRRKYQHNQTGGPGPSIENMFAVIDENASAPARDRLGLLDAVIFNVLVNNTDAHAKNYSLIIRHDEVRLAPLYDIMCATPYPGITPNLAQSVDDQRRGDHICGRHWRRMAEACGMNPAQTLVRVGDLVDRVEGNLGRARDAVETMPAGGDRILGQIVEAISRRCGRVRNNLTR